jgi:hypothetical protein
VNNGVSFNNTGTVEVSSGTLAFFGGYTQTAGTTRLSNNRTLKSSTTLALQGGSLTGSGTVQANVNASGATLAPGASAGTLIVNGNLTLGSGANLTFELGGATQGTQYDYLDVNGAVTLGGNLNVSFINSFQNSVQYTDLFTVVTADSTFSGAFGNVASGARLNTSDGYGSFLVNYSGTSLQLSQYVPEPGAYALAAGLGLVGFGLWRRGAWVRVLRPRRFGHS